ncbi:MAG: alpha/beta hydrolase family esterase [Patescibacteria group bacterium]
MTAVKLKCGAEERTYYRYVPPQYKPSQPVPLVIMLHGAGGNGPQTDRMTRWSALAEKAGFIVAYPHGGNWPGIYDWSDGNQDDAFLLAVIDEIKKGFSLDTERIYMCGYSYGGSMAATFAFRHAELLAALALVSPAWMQADPRFDIDPYKITQPKVPLPVFVWRGEYEFWPSAGEIDALIEYWTDFNQTKKTPRIVEELIYKTFIYEGGKAEVRYTEIEDGVHSSFCGDDFAKIWYDFFTRQKRL